MRSDDEHVHLAFEHPPRHRTSLARDSVDLVHVYIHSSATVDPHRSSDRKAVLGCDCSRDDELALTAKANLRSLCLGFTSGSHLFQAQTRASSAPLVQDLPISTGFLWTFRHVSRPQHSIIRATFRADHRL